MLVDWALWLYAESSGRVVALGGVSGY